MSDLGYDPEVPSAEEQYSELIYQADGNAREHRFKAGVRLGVAAATGVGGTLFGIEISELSAADLPEYYDIIPIAKGAYIAAVVGATALATSLGVNSALQSARAGSEVAAMKAHHHHDKYEELVANEQNQGKSPGQPE